MMQVVEMMQVEEDKESLILCSQHGCWWLVTQGATTTAAMIWMGKCKKDVTPVH